MEMFVIVKTVKKEVLMFNGFGTNNKPKFSNITGIMGCAQTFVFSKREYAQESFDQAMRNDPFNCIGMVIKRFTFIV